MPITFKYTIPVIILIMSLNLQAREIDKVNIPEQADLAGQTLHLNGAGIRSKFFFDIYIGALYLPRKANDVKQILAMAGPKRVLMHVLYDEVEKQRLTGGWTTGFENNNPPQAFDALKPRLLAFNNLFETVKAGDVILLDYLPGNGTRVTINQQVKGTVAGEDFYRAMLKVWLGDDPADDDLKQAMLGNS